MAKKKKKNKICFKDAVLTHQDAVLLYQQLKKHPEICDDCNIVPCVFAKYLYGT